MTNNPKQTTATDVKPVLDLYRRHLLHVFALTAFLTGIAVIKLVNGNIREALFISVFTTILAGWGGYYTWIYFAVARTIGKPSQ